MKAGLICIFIESCILNEAKVSSYSQAILRHEEILFKGKKLLNKNYWSKISFMGYNYWLQRERERERETSSCSNKVSFIMKGYKYVRPPREKTSRIPELQGMWSIIPSKMSLTLSLPHTHTHTHTQRKHDQAKCSPAVNNRWPEILPSFLLLFPKDCEGVRPYLLHYSSTTIP